LPQFESDPDENKIVKDMYQTSNGTIFLLYTDLLMRKLAMFLSVKFRCYTALFCIYNNFI